MIKDFAAWRNESLKNKSGWVMVLDPDEKLSGPLPTNLDKQFNYAFRRDDWFLGKKLRFGETAHVWLTRLIQPKTGQWVGRVHERFVSRLQVEYLKSPRILHRRQISVSQFIDRLNNYSDLRAQEINKFLAFELIFYPPLKFVKSYILQLGCLDGMPGLIMAFCMSLHSLLVRIKVYEKTR